jgi:hypothetical protein
VARPKIQLDSKLQASLKDASLLLTGVKKRAFIAQATQDYFQSSPRLAERYMGWSRKAIGKAMSSFKRSLTTPTMGTGKASATSLRRASKSFPQLDKIVS